MMTFLDGLGTAFDSVIQTTLQATVLAALVLILQRLLGKRLAPRWHYALWLLVLVRLFLPWTPESPTSVFNFVRTENATPTQLPILIAEPDWHLIDSYVEVSAVPPFTDPPNSFRLDIPELRITWTDWLRLLWVSVAALLALYVCIVNGSLWWRVRREPAIDAGPVAAEFAECKQAMGARASICLIRTRAVSTPALLGLLRPRLLLPESMEHTLSREELRHVFLHELAHYRRGDLIVNWLMVACNIVHWFNPALWYAFHRMRADRELACDALAMSYIAPNESASYGRTLLRLLEHVARPRPLPGLVGVMERRSHLKKRIRGIAGFKPGSYRWSVLAVVLISVLSSVGLTNASSNGPYVEAPALAGSLDVEPDSPVGTPPPTLPEEHSENHLEEATVPPTDHAIRVELDTDASVPEATPQMFNWSISLPAGVVEPASTDDASDLRSQEEDESIESPRVIPHGDHSMTADSATVDLDSMAVTKQAVAGLVAGSDKTDAPPLSNPVVVEKLTNPVSVEFENEHIGAITASVGSTMGLTIELDTEVIAPRGLTPSERARFATDGMVPYVKLNDVPLQDALKAILRPLGLAYEVRGDTVYISTPDRLHTQEAVDDTKRLPTFEKVKVSVAFNKGTTLMEAAAKLADAADVNVIVDRRVVNADDGSSSDPTAWVVQPQKFRDTPLLDVLRAILEPLGLTFAVEPGFIWISTPDRIATESFEELETRAYHLELIPGLNSDGASREAFLTMIRRMVYLREPNTDKAMSRVAVDDEKDVLVVTSAPSCLDQLEKLVLFEPAPIAAQAQETSADPSSDSPPTLFTVYIQSYELSNKALARAISGWEPLDSGFEVLWGDPQAYTVPSKITSPQDAIGDADAVNRGNQVVRTTFGSAARYALEMPEGISLPGFDLRGYLGHAPDFRREVFVPNLEGSGSPPRDNQARAKDQFATVLPGIEARPDGSLAFELLWLHEADNSKKQYRGAFVRYAAQRGRWTALAIPSGGQRHYLIFIRIVDGASSIGADGGAAHAGPAAELSGWNSKREMGAAANAETKSADAGAGKGDRFRVAFAAYQMTSRAFWKLRKGWEVNDASSRVLGLQDYSNDYDLPSPAGFQPEKATAGIDASALGSQTLSLVGHARTVKPYGDGLLGFFFRKKNATGSELDEQEASDATKPHFLLPAGSQEAELLRVYPQIARDGNRLRVAIAFIPDSSVREHRGFDDESAEFVAYTTTCDDWHAAAIKLPNGEYLVCFVRVERAGDASVA